MNAFRIGHLNYESVITQNVMPVLLGFYWLVDSKGVNTEHQLGLLAERCDGKLWVGKVDYDYARKIFSINEITDTPTFIIYKNGKPIARKEEYNGYKTILEFVNKHLGIEFDELK